MGHFQRGTRTPSFLFERGENIHLPANRTTNKRNSQIITHANFVLGRLNAVSEDSDYIDRNYLWHIQTADAATPQLLVQKYDKAPYTPQYKSSGVHQKISNPRAALHDIPSVLVNLPAANWLLMCYCNAYEPNVNDYPFLAGLDHTMTTQVGRYLLPPLGKILKFLCPIGAMVTQPEVRSLGYNNYMPDVRVVSLNGWVDVQNIWSCADVEVGSEAMKLRPKQYIGFILSMQETTDTPDDCQTFSFCLDTNKEHIERVRYTKKLYWKITPVVLSREEHLDPLFSSKTVKKLVYMESEAGGKRAVHLVYEPHVWKVGMLEGPSNERMGKHVFITSDPTTDEKQAKRLPTVGIWTDVNGAFTTGHIYSQ